MVSLGWCKKRRRGIKLVEPNDNLSREFLQNSEDTLNDIREDETNMWKAAKKYYFEYFLIYSFFMKIGIKCEIHECTISLSKMFENKEILPEGISRELENNKGLRVDNQYYLKNKEVKIDFSELSDFYLKMKSSINSLNAEKIASIRNIIKRI